MTLAPVAPDQATAFAVTLRRRCAEAAARARQVGQPVIASHSQPAPAWWHADPVAFFARGAVSHDYRAYWERPAQGTAFAGLGAARVIRCDGPDRFAAAATAVRADLAMAAYDESELPARPASALVYLGGFAFDPDRARASDWAGYPDGLLVLPRLLLVVRDEAATLTVNALIAPGSDGVVEAAAALRDLAALTAAPAAGHNSWRQPAGVVEASDLPSAEDWQASVRVTAADVRAGQFEKVVLARTLQVRADTPFDQASALRALRTAYPSAYIFAVAVRNHCFLGATPELLVQLRGRDVATTCLAGSTARGATPGEDERLARVLLESTKNRVEHQIVVRYIQEALAPLCDELQANAAAPRLMRVRNVQHLYTPVRGRLNADRSILDLIARLHPTPAVGGFPRDAALAAIRAREPFDRGWYAGPVGWLDRDGGEFAVGIRSALLADDRATLYAGGGIVASSDPAAEYAETDWKFKPMLAALGVTCDI